ncbi:hypothetical protein ACFQ3S_15035 [Mucilaginibacter terrae]|uniref:hypothetical protein n=1 Tax=Mucilaginibacter terrae TaxID=1955052 RepID=UPI003643824C
MAILSLSLIAYSFTWYADKQQALLWASKCLLQSFDNLAEPKLKKWDLTLTPDAFIRFKKTYQGGRQEYYSFNLHRFKDIDYIGTNIKGTLRIKTLGYDVIVQTYNDPKGNVDSMSTSLKIPVKGLEAEQLDSLLNNLIYLKSH